jgi:hypothetical protein
MREPKEQWRNLEFGHKINIALNLFSTVVMIAAVLAMIAGKWWNPFELGRDYEQHCLEQKIKTEQVDSALAHTVRDKDNISLIPRANAEDNQNCQSYIIIKRR